MAHWNVDRADTECKCSNCNKDFLDFVFSDDVCMNSEIQGYPKYCPNCGEKMDETVDK